MNIFGFEISFSCVFLLNTPQLLSLLPPFARRRANFVTAFTDQKKYWSNRKTQRKIIIWTNDPSARISTAVDRPTDSEEKKTTDDDDPNFYTVRGRTMRVFLCFLSLYNIQPRPTLTVRRTDDDGEAKHRSIAIVVERTNSAAPSSRRCASVDWCSGDLAFLYDRERRSFRSNRDCCRFSTNNWPFAL